MLSASGAYHGSRQIEVFRHRRAGEALENLAITLQHRTQTLAEGLVAPLTLDMLGDRFPDRVGDADPLRACYRLELVCLLRRKPQRHEIGRASCRERV